jgi:hypothetical protein
MTPTAVTSRWEGVLTRREAGFLLPESAGGSAGAGEQDFRVGCRHEQSREIIHP